MTTRRWLTSAIALLGVFAFECTLAQVALGQDRSNAAPRSTRTAAPREYRPSERYEDRYDERYDDPRYDPAHERQTSEDDWSSERRTDLRRYYRRDEEHYRHASRVEPARNDDRPSAVYDRPTRSAPAAYAERRTDYDPFDDDYVEYDRDYNVRYRPYRVARTARQEPMPMAEEPMPVPEEVSEGEWEGEYESEYRGSSGGYDVFDEGGLEPLDGTHYRSPYNSGCTSGCGSCDSCCDDDCGSCGHPCGGFGLGLLQAACRHSIWVRADYLLWWTKGEALPPLVTTSPDQTPRTEAGVLGQPGTEILFGDTRYLNEARSGGRIEFGGYLDACQTIGLGGGFFALGDGTAAYYDASDGLPILARPFVNAVTETQDSALTAYSSTATGDIIAGDILVHTSNELMNASAFMTGLVWRECGARIDAIGGYRFSRFDEDLSITENLVVTEQGGLIPFGTTFNALDSFDVSNQFNGADLGLTFESRSCRWAVDGMIKLGLGNMHQQANIWGRTISTPPGGAPLAQEGDLLAMPSNIGFYSRNKFSIVPELRLNLSYFITPRWTVNVGYTFVYWTDVVRAGQLVDTTVNTTQLAPPVVGPARPAFTFVNSDLWAQGLNFGTAVQF